MPTYQTETLPLPIRWTSRFALFSFGVCVLGLVMHRLGLPTPVAFNMLVLAYLGCAIAFVLALVGAAMIWQTGRNGTARVVTALLLCFTMLAGAVAALAVGKSYPAINDVSTDTRAPPQFVELAKLRTQASNPIAYPATFASVQATAYPDLKSLVIDRSLDETYEVVLDVLKRQRLGIVREDPAGFIEAIDRTLVVGFTDDVAVRITGDEAQARIDIRSAARFGSLDFGNNALRVRTLLKEIVVRLEETIPAADGIKAASGDKSKKNAVKEEKGSDRKQPIPRKPLNRERTDVQREPERKAQRPEATAGQGPDKRQARSAE
jgi:uncharacterized protein (DUF1499 family)